ncbi:hypothetical protein O3P69_007143 [Scylla paramamosain]|uniref:Uncharacterized protein n=1 Tax=Scylla paramamosain TaxID=85552 RepID=A0AAW0V5U0_SCYPA
MTEHSGKASFERLLYVPPREIVKPGGKSEAQGSGRSSGSRQSSVINELCPWEDTCRVSGLCSINLPSSVDEVSVNTKSGYKEALSNSYHRILLGILER